VLSVVIATYRRKGALRSTLRALLGRDGPPILPAGSEVLVADNASGDGTLDMLAAEFPEVRTLALADNHGVEGFNRAAAQARGEHLLILDDDAVPGREALVAAMDVLARDESIGAIALLPVNARTGRSEWPFARVAHARFPFMGCANLVRADAWRRLGGYDAAFFLYRNDVDLAMRLLENGLDVRFVPEWTARHDSPDGAKSDRWLRLGTRNFVWLARRHGRGVWKWLGLGAGIASCLRHAGWSVARVREVLRGVRDGFREPPPPCEPHSSGAAWRRMVRMRLPWNRG
jgi:GT2 family glycosyltransferase